MAIIQLPSCSPASVPMPFVIKYQKKITFGGWGLEYPQDSDTCREEDQFSEDSNERNEQHTYDIQRSYFRKMTS